MKIPPRPEVIRERYADFLRKQSVFMENYKRHFLVRAGTGTEPEKQKRS